MEVYRPVVAEKTPLLPPQERRSYKAQAVGAAALLFLGAAAFQSRVSHPTSSLINAQGRGTAARAIGSTDTEAKRPHVILFTVDDMGWNDMGYQSSDLPFATPFMNALADKGVKLTHYYTAPSCTPSRVSMMTGKFPYKNGFQNIELQVFNHYGVPMSNKLMPQFMQELGYKTVMYGKWNIGHCNAKYLPHERGFDHFIGYLGPGHGYSNHISGKYAGAYDLIESVSFTNSANEVVSTEWHTGEAYQGIYDTLLYRDKAVSLLYKHAKAYPDNGVPLFVWSAQHGIHGERDADPTPPDELLSEDNKKYLVELDALSSDGIFWDKRKVTATVAMAIDNTLKRMVEVMEETGMLENAVIFVNSDNGAQTDSTEGHPGNNYPMRSMKFSYFEGGIRVPAFVYAPGRLAASRAGSSYHGVMHHVDLLATFVELGAGPANTIDASYDLDSVSHWTAIAGDGPSPRNELVLNLPRSTKWKLGDSTADGEGVALRVGKYKLLLNHAYDGWWVPENGHQSQMMFEGKCVYSWYSVGTGANCSYHNWLFDLEADAFEQTNLWGNAVYKDVQANLVARAEELAAAQGSYGSILYETYMDSNRTHGSYETTWKANNWYVSPWGCDVIL